MRPLCGSCPRCLTLTNRVCTPPRRRSTRGPVPSAAGLEKHARKFGPAQVAETAAEYGVSVMVERAKPGLTGEQRKARRRRRSR
jgi:Zn-dependent alcohol dehydrogenase